ncbi:prolipoprotein diacylglyceryl transferase [Sphingorhabdus lutea]|nr:prolipoprotein diacylglyceryl transferase [Sphingorhabdus lutea]
MAAATSQAIHFDDLGLSPIALDLGFFQIRWYSLAYFGGVLLGWWYFAKLTEKGGSPISKDNIDDFIIYAVLGIILGGRLGYCIFYNPELFLTPIKVLQMWNGGMSFHGGVIGVSIALFIFCKQKGLSLIRVADYLACVYPIGHILGRFANFVNGELWGKPTDVSWAIIFPDADNLPRHPSQLYEAGLEGVAIFMILFYMFWRTDARNRPGLLVGTFAILSAVARFGVEFFREPDEGVNGLLGMSMGQVLTIPMIFFGLYFLITSKKRAV